MNEYTKYKQESISKNTKINPYVDTSITDQNLMIQLPQPSKDKEVINGND